MAQFYLVHYSIVCNYTILHYVEEFLTFIINLIFKTELQVLMQNLRVKSFLTNVIHLMYRTLRIKICKMLFYK